MCLYVVFESRIINAAGYICRLAVSNIEPFSVVLQFTPGFDGNSSITKWTVQALSARNATWTTIYETATEQQDTKSIEVLNLSPYMEYQLRLVANNVVGASEPSEPTRQFQTIQVRGKKGLQLSVQMENSTIQVVL